jgi:hypothetical protein
MRTESRQKERVPATTTKSKVALPTENGADNVRIHPHKTSASSASARDGELAPRLHNTPVAMEVGGGHRKSLETPRGELQRG